MDATYYFYQNKFTDRTHINNPFIEHDVVPSDQNYLTVRVPITYDMEDSLLSTGEIVPFQNKGIHWRRFISFPFNRIEYPDGFDKNENARKILDYISDHTILGIQDSTFAPLEFKYSSIGTPHKNVFQTRIPIGYLKQGEYVLHIQIPRKNHPNIVHIPFYRDR